MKGTNQTVHHSEFMLNQKRKRKNHNSAFCSGRWNCGGCQAERVRTKFSLNSLLFEKEIRLVYLFWKNSVIIYETLFLSWIWNCAPEKKDLFLQDLRLKNWLCQIKDSNVQVCFPWPQKILSFNKITENTANCSYLFFYFVLPHDCVQ